MNKTTCADPTEWFPMPVVLISYYIPNKEPNIMVAGYAGFSCWQPPMLCLGINRDRYTRSNLSINSELVVSLPDHKQINQVDYCGYISGVNHDKFLLTGLTHSPAINIAAPLINECPINFECKVEKIIPQGSHDLILLKVLTCHVDETRASEPIVLHHRNYLSVTKKLGELGLSQGRA